MSVPVVRMAERDLDLAHVPAAFVGRTSTYELQDPTLSIPRQLGEVMEKKPGEFAVVAHYWDIESGGLPLAERGLGHAHEMFDVPVPRDGGLQDLLREAASPDRRFAVVICSDISRAARDSYYGLKLEKDLEALGVPLLAADEPIAFDRRDPGTILFRRLKLSVAEWLRADIKRQSWNGMRTHIMQGWNSGRAPYGYIAEHVPHPVPSKRAEGKVKTRLRPDPRCAHVVPLIFQWRVEERFGYKRIKERLNSDLISYPPPVNPNPKQRSGLWTIAAIHRILSNPKYTGYVVWNRRDPKARRKDAKEWVWSAEPAHEALVGRELFDQSASIGKVTEGSRQGNEINSHPLTKRTYLLRSHVRCAICGRRMIGHTSGRLTYYRCETRRDDPHLLEEFPDHPASVSVREDVLHAAVEALFTDHIFGRDRARLLAEHFDALQSRAHAEHVQRIASLEARIGGHEQAKRRLVREMAALPDDDDLAATMRGDLREEYYREERARRALVEELDQLRAQEPPPPEDPGLLDELPLIPVTLEGTPEELVRELFAAFTLVVEYDKRRDEVQLSATITDSLATAIRPNGKDDSAQPGAVVLPFPVLFAPAPLPEPPTLSGRLGAPSAQPSGPVREAGDLGKIDSFARAEPIATRHVISACSARFEPRIPRPSSDQWLLRDGAREAAERVRSCA